MQHLVLDKWWFGTIVSNSHSSVRGANSQRIKGIMALQSSFEVFIRPQISLYFQVSSFFMPIKRVVNSFYILAIGVFEVPNIVINLFIYLFETLSWQINPPGHISKSAKCRLFTSVLIVLICYLIISSFSLIFKTLAM